MSACLRTAGWVLCVALIASLGPACTVDFDPDSCPATTTACGNECVDTLTNPLHCGGCDQPCDPGQVCNAGTCASSCTGGLVACDGGCVDPLTDREHCGGCDSPCDAEEVCTLGACAAECSPPTEFCGGVCVDTLTHPTHCGGCDQPCLPGEACVAGDCRMDCELGLSPCAGECVDLGSNRAHCGQCDNPCSDTETCDQGDCVPAEPLPTGSLTIAATGGDNSHSGLGGVGDAYEPWATCEMIRGSLTAGADVYIENTKTDCEFPDEIEAWAGLPGNPSRLGVYFRRNGVNYRGNDGVWPRLTCRGDSHCLSIETDDDDFEAENFALRSTGITGHQTFSTVHVLDVQDVTLRNLKISNFGTMGDLLVAYNDRALPWAGVHVSGAQRVRMTRLDLRYAGFEGVRITDMPSHVMLDRSVVQGVISDAVHHGNSWTQCTYLGIVRNYLQGAPLDPNENQGDGVRLYYGDIDGSRQRCVLIYGNTIENFGENGINLSGAKWVQIAYNVIRANAGNDEGSQDGNDDRDAQGAISREGTITESQGTTVRNNVIYDNASGPVGYYEDVLLHNTVANNKRDFAGPSSSFDPLGTDSAFWWELKQFGNDVHLLNNAVQLHSADHRVAAIESDLGFSTRIAGNHVYAPGAEGKYNARNWIDDPWTALILVEFQTAANMAVGTESDVDPFVAVGLDPYRDGSYDFTPSSTSALVGAAVDHGRTLGTGSATPIVELWNDDACNFITLFYDDGGQLWQSWLAELGLEPDSVIIDGSEARVVDTNCGVTNALYSITLATPITYSHDAPVWISDGAGTTMSDVGAIQSAGSWPQVGVDGTVPP